MIDSGSAKSGMIDSAIAKSKMIGRTGSKTCPETWIGLESEDAGIGLEIIGSRNMESTGVATLGQMLGKEIEDCGEVIEEMNGKVFSWKETSLEMNICLVTKFNNL